MISEPVQELEAPRYHKVIVNPRFCYFRSKSDSKSTIAAEISYGLSRKAKFISPKFFYDDTGSKLFELICSLPEYYLTKTEMRILDTVANELPDNLAESHVLVELGSGSSKKTRKLLQALSKIQERLEYYPIDISDILKDSSIRLHNEYDNLRVTGIIDQYEPALEFIKKIDNQRKIIAFLGSSLGNFEPKSAYEFLTRIYQSMRRKDLFLIGLDLVKNQNVLESAYNDSQGITAKFNLNLLTRINREFGSDFDLDKFAHHAIFNKKSSRIEMYLRSKVKQEVNITSLGLALKFRKDELINTEYSYKYTISKIRTMAKKTGFNVIKIWTDKRNQFALALFSRENL